MKILQINCVYEKGSTGKITHDIHCRLLKDGYEGVVCYGRGDDCSHEGVYKICSEKAANLNHLRANITGVMYSGAYFSTKKLISVIRKEKPDIVHLQCINGYFVNIYKLVEFLRDNNIRTVLTLHAEFMYTGGCGYALDCDRWAGGNGHGCGKCPRWRSETGSYFLDRTSSMWKRMKKAFNGFDEKLVVVSVSFWLMERAKRSSVFEGKRHAVVYNGLNTEIFHPYDTAALRKKHGITDEKIIFHATAMFNLNPDHLKGGYYVNELAKRLKGRKMKFFVAGPCAEGTVPDDSIILLGNISDQAVLAEYYSMADVTLLTSKRETYSMITAESLCCGTPVAGFLAGGPESIAIEQYCDFVEYGRVDLLEEAVLKCLEEGCGDELVQRAVARYDTKAMTEGYEKIYESLMV